MKDLTVLENKKIESMIYEIRGKQVMFDSDLALLYQCTNGTKEINQAVSRNIERFPERFSWRLTEEESVNFLVTNCDQKRETRGGRYKCPRVFTEQGVAMLATILKSKVATEISIQIMDAFVMMREYISTSLLEQKYINNQVMKNTERIEENFNNIKLLQETFSKLEEKRKANEIFFEGQIYDAYSKILNIFKTAEKSLTIIDGYADNSVLDMISKISVPVLLIVKKKSQLNKTDLKKYRYQYDNLTIIYSNSFHDRYIIVDENIVYHCGASINYAGARAFGIDVIGDIEVKTAILTKIKEIEELEHLQ